MTTKGPDGLRSSSRADSSQKSVGQLVKEISEDISTLVHKEIELAKKELGGSVAEKAKGAVVIAIAAVMGLFALIYLTLAVRDAIDLALPAWLADVLTAVVLLIIGGIAALIAKRKLTKPIKADMTKKTLKDDVDFAKNLRRR